MEKKITRIPASSELYPDSRKHVGIYCRISSSSKKQLHSLAVQVSGLTRRVASCPTWILEDIYMDVASGADNSREEYRRMLEDAAAGKINLIVVKSSSRFGRDTLEVTKACKELEKHHCDVYFDTANDFYSHMGALIVETTAGIDQADNENRRAQISWGIRRQMESGESKVFDRACYGYAHDADGNLIICEDQAVVVRKIFLLYLSGASVLTIKRTLEAEGILAPRGGKNWSKKTIDMILANIKYSGSSYVHTHYIAEEDKNQRIIMTDNKGKQMITLAVENNHPPIISPETFAKTQQMRMERSNIVYNPDGTKSRKSTHYSSKAKAAKDNCKD